MIEPGVLLSLFVVAVILTIGAVLGHSSWRIEVEGLAVLVVSCHWQLSDWDFTGCGRITRADSYPERSWPQVEL